ncbi:2-oxoacid:acceptor oxidoreductase subunit alpha [uncultured Rikenella sp.]|uniref:2-oxoacid:acceptor oxidoreductase subunit alpha n=1 Tax=uncultured Rikenella sp. TaxID=368003 RepID=UPI0026221526|nr:2-oxoacid:acceptor oxidoreductase subunit alpha [uncultured Rikenella sp.]
MQQTKDVVIRFSGDSGDGMQLTGTLFSDTSALGGNSIATFPDYPAEIRAPQGTMAGVSGFQVHIGSEKVLTSGDYCDLLVAMNAVALRANRKWLKKGATVIVDADSLTEAAVKRAGFQTLDPFEELGIADYNIIRAPISSMTKEALAQTGLDTKAANKCKNMFALGICYCLYDMPLEHTENYLRRKFAKKPAVAEANLLALKAGYNYAANTHIFTTTYQVPAAELPKGTYRTIAGNQATAWGLIAASEKSGRPLFCGSYPITPATAILEELAKRKDLGVKTLQVEDEIAGICTAIGASFAGNMAVTTTSGPGLSLKSEALGLAVMTELPLVVVDVQRGGPSTGLPTKTEQADLYQALWGRNGECPLVVMSACTPSGCFDAAFMAAKIAMEHMTPVILLSDGYIANGSEAWRIPSMNDYPEIKPPVVTERPEGGFLPYVRDPERLARSWALPGSPGCEHRLGGLEKQDCIGCLSHDPQNHQRMVELRAEKVARVANYIPEQEVYGDSIGGDLLVVGWGGTYGQLRTAVDAMRAEGKSVSHCHFSYINPLPKGTEGIFSKFKQIVVCELNMGQFANYLRMNFPHIDFQQYNKVQGLPFTVVELTEHFDTLLTRA